MVKVPPKTKLLSLRHYTQYNKIFNGKGTTKTQYLVSLTLPERFCKKMLKIVASCLEDKTQNFDKTRMVQDLRSEIYNFITSRNDIYQNHTFLAVFWGRGYT